MKYKPDEFFRLMAAVEEQGGEHLDESHDTVYLMPDKDKGLPGLELDYCGQSMLFVIPDLPGESPPGKTKVCAMDDDMGLWPRFRDARAFGAE